MRKLKQLREVRLNNLDFEYQQLRESLAKGNYEEQFNKKGQRTQSSLLAQIRVKVEGIQELNRTLDSLKNV